MTGLYRLSITAKRPCSVEFGGKPLTDVRSVEIYHEAPMFIDELAGVRGVIVEAGDAGITAVQLLPAHDEPLTFRITAEETVPELDVLQSRQTIGKFKTPLPHRRIGGHLRAWSNARLASVSHRLTRPDGASDHIAHAIALPFVALAGATSTLPRALATTGVAGAICTAALWASMQTLHTGVVAAPIACDPSRTYINGRLYKNLAAVRIRIASGRILGFTTP